MEHTTPSGTTIEGNVLGVVFEVVEATEGSEWPRASYGLYSTVEGATECVEQCLANAQIDDPEVVYTPCDANDLDQAEYHEDVVAAWKYEPQPFEQYSFRIERRQVVR